MTFDHVNFQNHVTQQNHYIFTNTLPMITKLDRMVIYLDGLLFIKSHDPLIMWSHKIYCQIKNHYIFTTTVSIATRLGRMVTHPNGLLLIKLHDPSITSSCEITQQPNIIISTLPQSISPPN